MTVCTHCEQEIEWDGTTFNKVTETLGYWRDTSIQDGCCPSAPTINGQELHSPKQVVS